MAKLHTATDRASDIKVARPWILPSGAMRRSTSLCASSGSCTLLNMAAMSASNPPSDSDLSARLATRSGCPPAYILDLPPHLFSCVPKLLFFTQNI